MMNDEIRTVLYPLPPDIKAYTAYVNGYYTIVINDNLSDQARLRAYYHERIHISNGDFYDNNKADFIEIRAHGGVNNDR